MHTQCPLWVKSRHGSACQGCPLYTRKRTLEPRAAGYLTKAFKHNKVVMELRALRMIRANWT